jgi:hypothetical protein
MKKITIDQLRTAFVALGWTLDRFGHLQSTGANGKKYRIKTQATSVRVEVQVAHAATAYSPASNEWVKVTGAYLKDISIEPTGNIVIGKGRFKSLEVVQ